MAALMKRLVDSVVERVRNLKPRTYDVVVIGLDNAGKSSIVECIIEHDKLNGTVADTLAARRAAASATTTTTLQQQLNVEKRSLHTTVKKRECHISLYDFVGRCRTRPLWEQAYGIADAIIFVVDAADRLRTPIVCFELNMLLNKLGDSNRKVPILVVLNKRDIGRTMSVTEFELLIQRNLTCQTDTFLVVVEGSAVLGQLGIWRDFENFLICVDEIQRKQMLKQQPTAEKGNSVAPAQSEHGLHARRAAPESIPETISNINTESVNSQYEKEADEVVERFMKLSA